MHLTRIYRQEDAAFIEMLQAVRMACPSPQHIELLESRIGAQLDCSDGIRPTRLFPYKRDVHAENSHELQKIGGDEVTFTATDKGLDHFVAALDKHCQATRIITLKVGAQVVLLRNLDFSRALVNGSRGIVVDFVASEDLPCVPLVRFANGQVLPIAQAEWKMESGKVVTCSRRQIPLALCWASSVHKAQGASLDKVEMRLASVFEDGQAYTALSRCTSLEGLSLLDLDVSKITANPRVVQFYRQLDE